MTDRLYLRDAYLREFDARVVAARPEAGGTGAVLELDRTAFYPASGGQLHDTGLLDGLRVVEVAENTNGGVLHRVAGGAGVVALVGREIRGRIDWERRFDHMQQHTGQHILSQAALRELGAATAAVHLGAERCTVDLDAPAFSAEEAARIEDAANAAVMANYPVRIHFVDEAEIERWGLRRPPKKSGSIRVVEIEDFDRSACGGTHVRATGEIGAIALTGWERYKGGTRVEFLCGWRALRDHRAKSRTLAEIGRAFSAAPSELIEAAARLAAREREAARRIEDLRERLLILEAEGWRARLGLPAVVAEVVTGRDIDEVRGLAQALVRGGGVVALFGAADGRLVAARSPDLSLDAAALLRTVLEQFGGRGGGKPDLAQGAVPNGALTAALDAARRLAEDALRRA